MSSSTSRNKRRRERLPSYGDEPPPSYGASEAAASSTVRMLGDDLPGLGERTSSELSTNSQLLHDKDIIAVIDLSTSMKLEDPDSGETRLESVLEVLIDLCEAAQQYDPDGITVITFNGRNASNIKIYENITHDVVMSTLSALECKPGSYLAPVLEQVFASYLSRREIGEGKTGILTMVFHDGAPKSRINVANAIIAFSHNLREPHEAGIVFVRADHGRSKSAGKFFKFLDDNLNDAKYDIVNCINVEEVEERGAKATFLSGFYE